MKTTISLTESKLRMLVGECIQEAIAAGELDESWAGLWSGLKSGLKGVGNAFKSGWNTGDGIKGGFQNLGNGLKGAWDDAKTGYDKGEIRNNINQIDKMYDQLYNFCEKTGMVQYLLNKIKPLETMKRKQRAARQKQRLASMAPESTGGNAMQYSSNSRRAEA